LLNCFFKEIRIDRAFNDLTERIECVNHVPEDCSWIQTLSVVSLPAERIRDARMAGDLSMPEKSAAWLEAECLRRCRLLALSRHLEAVKIQRIKPTGNGPNWQVAAFKPELDGVAYQEAMRVIAHLRGTYALAKGRAA
jgi:hypothetical protein